MDKGPNDYFEHFVRYNMDSAAASNMLRILNVDEEVAKESLRLLGDRNQQPTSQSIQSPTVDSIMGMLPDAYEKAREEGMRKALTENKIVPEQFLIENPNYDVLHVARATNPEYMEQRKRVENAMFENELPGIGPMGMFEFFGSDEDPSFLESLSFLPSGEVKVLSETKRTEFLDYIDRKAEQAFESKYVLPQINSQINSVIPEDFVKNKSEVGELERGLRERLQEDGLSFTLDIDNDGKIGLKGVDEEDIESTWAKSISEIGIGFAELANTALELIGADVEEDYDDEDVNYVNALFDRGVRKELAKRWRNDYVTNAKSLEAINAKAESEGVSMDTFFDYFGVLDDLIASSAVPLVEVGGTALLTKKAGRRAWSRMAKSDKKIVKNHVGTAQLTTTGIISTGLQMAHVKESVRDEAWYQNLDPMQKFMYTSIQAAGEIAPALVGGAILKRGANKLRSVNFEKAAESTYTAMVGKVVGTALAGLGRGFLEESITEGVTAAVQYYNDYKFRTLGGDKSAEFDVDEMFNRALSAAMAGGVMGLAFAGLGSGLGAIGGTYRGIKSVKDQKRMDSDPKYREYREKIETITSDPAIKKAKNEIDELAAQLNNSKDPQEKIELQKRMDEVVSNFGIRHVAITRAYDRLKKENPELHNKLFQINSLINNLVARYKAIPVEDSPAKNGIEKTLHDAIKRRSELETEGDIQSKVAEEINKKVNEVNTKVGRFRTKQGYAPQSMTIDAQVEETLRAAEVERHLNSLTTATKEQTKEMYGVMRNTFGLPAKQAYHAAEVANRMILNMAKRSGMSFDAARQLITFKKGDNGSIAALRKSGALFQGESNGIEYDPISGLTYEYEKDQEHVQKMKEEGRITDQKYSLSDFEGELMWVHGPDDAAVMTIRYGDKVLFEGKGGPYYPIRFESQNAFWASRDKTMVRDAVRELNKGARNTPSGNGYAALLTGGYKKILNSTLGYRGATEILMRLAEMTTNGRSSFGLTEARLKRVMIKMIKNPEYNSNQELANGLSGRSTMQEVAAKFYEAFDEMSFEKRESMFQTGTDSFLSLLKDEINNSPEVQRLAMREFMRNKHSKNPNTTTVSVTTLREGLSYMLAEPHVRDTFRERAEDEQSAFAVLEAVRPEGMDKDADLFEAAESDAHESYPYMIKVKPGVKVRVHFLNDASVYSKSFSDPETGTAFGPKKDVKLTAKKQAKIRKEREASEAKGNKPKKFGDEPARRFGGAIQASVVAMKVTTRSDAKGEIDWQPTPKQSMKDSGISNRNEVVKAAAEQLKNGEITTYEYHQIVDENSPIGSINTFFEAVGEEHAAEALGSKADRMLNDLVDDDGNALERVGLRLDIPAYLNNNAWVVTAHDGTTKSGKAISYLPAARIRNVEFETNPKAALGVATGKSKSTFARMMGEPVEIEGNTWEEVGKRGMEMIEEIVNSPEWTQVGMNPFRHSYFWDRKTKAPVVAAEEVIQVGGNVYAKNVQHTSIYDPRFAIKDPKTGEELKSKDGSPVLFQGEKGAMVAEDSRFIIYALTDPDVSTPLHELAHVFEHYLTPEERADVMSWAGHTEWTRDTSELFARGFEKFLSEKYKDVTLTPGMKKLFLGFRTWLLDIYQGITGSPIDIELNAKMRTLYGKMIEPTRDQERRQFKMKRAEFQDEPKGPPPVPFKIQRTRFQYMSMLLDRLFGDRYREVKDLANVFDNRLPRAMKFAVREMLFYGRSASRLEDARDQIFKPFHEKRRSAGVSIDVLSEFMRALHAPERNAMIYERSEGKVKDGSGISDQEAREIIGKYSESELATLRSLANDVYNMMGEIRELMVEYGLESEETVKAYENMFQFYVPLRGFADPMYEGMTDAGVKLPRGSGLSVKGSGNVKAKGRSTEAANVLLQVERMYQATVLAGERNNVMGALYNLAKRNPDPSVWEVITGPVPESMRDRAVEIRVDGQRVNIVFADKRYADQLNNATGKKLKSIMDVLDLLLIRPFNNFLRASYTTLSPAFIAINYLRDAGAVIFNAGAEASIPDGLAVKDFKWRIISQSPMYIKSLYRLSTGREVDPELKAFYDEYRYSGGRTGWAYSMTIEELAKRVESEDDPSAIRKAMNTLHENTFQIVENLNQAVEDSFRLAAYIEARKAGQDVESSALLAKNVTVNFNQSGELGPLLNTLYLFFGSSVQGTKRFAKSMFTMKSTKKPKGVLDAWHNNLNNAQKFAVFSMNLGGMITMMNYAISDEDEPSGVLYYDRISDYEKERNIVIMTGPKSHITIPLPYGYNIFHQFGVMMVEMANQKRTPTNTAMFLANSFVNSFVPFSFGEVESLGDLLVSFVPTAFKPGADVTRNKTYYGSPVARENIPMFNQKPNSELSYRGPDWWREVFKLLNQVTGGSEQVSGAIDINPDYLTYLISSYIGGAGNFIAKSGQLIEKSLRAGDDIRKIHFDANEIPITNKILGSENRYYDFDLYEERSVEIAQLASEIKETKPEYSDRYKGVEQLYKADKYVNKKRREIWKAKNEAKNIEDYVERVNTMFELSEMERELLARFNKYYDELRGKN